MTRSATKTRIRALVVWIVLLCVALSPGAAFAAEWFDTYKATATIDGVALAPTDSAVRVTDPYNTGTDVFYRRSFTGTGVSGTLNATFRYWSVPSFAVVFGPQVPSLTTDGSGFISIFDSYASMIPTNFAGEATAIAAHRGGAVSWNTLSVSVLGYSQPTMYGGLFKYNPSGCTVTAPLANTTATTSNHAVTGMSGPIKLGTEQRAIVAAYRAGGVVNWRIRVLRRFQIGSMWSNAIVHEQSGQYTGTLNSTACSASLVPQGQYQQAIPTVDGYAFSNQHSGQLFMAYDGWVRGQYTIDNAAAVDAVDNRYLFDLEMDETSSTVPPAGEYPDGADASKGEWLDGQFNKLKGPVEGLVTSLFWWLDAIAEWEE